MATRHDLWNRAKDSAERARRPLFAAASVGAAAVTLTGCVGGPAAATNEGSPTSTPTGNSVTHETATATPTPTATPEAAPTDIPVTAGSESTVDSEIGLDAFEKLPAAERAAWLSDKLRTLYEDDTYMPSIVLADVEYPSEEERIDLIDYFVPDGPLAEQSEQFLLNWKSAVEAAIYAEAEQSESEATKMAYGFFANTNADPETNPLLAGWLENIKRFNSEGYASTAHVDVSSSFELRTMPDGRLAVYEYTSGDSASIKRVVGSTTPAGPISDIFEINPDGTVNYGGYARGFTRDLELPVTES